MARTVQRLAIIGAIIASFIGFLAYAPNTEGIAQLDRVRTLAALMKLTHVISNTAESLGLSTRPAVTQKLFGLFRYLKSPEENVGVEVEDTLIENIPVRIVRPLNSKDNLPAIVYSHGGAFYLGTLDMYNGITSALARLTNAVVISVDYRLAPDHPFPAGLDDCYTVAKYVLEHGNSKKLRIDRDRVALAGDSAGGNIAAVNTMRFVTNPSGKRTPSMQVLIYPVLQVFDLMLPSYMEGHFEFFRYTIDHALSLYLRDDIDPSIYANNHTSVEQKRKYRKYVDWSLIPEKYRKVYKQPMTDNNEGDPQLIEKVKKALSPEISPLLVEDDQLVKLPPTYILSVGHDRLRDESFIYEGRLKHNGVPVVHNHYEHTFHAALNFQHGKFGLDIANEMMNDMAKYIKENL